MKHVRTQHWRKWRSLIFFPMMFLLLLIQKQVGLSNVYKRRLKIKYIWICAKRICHFWKHAGSTKLLENIYETVTKSYSFCQAVQEQFCVPETRKMVKSVELYKKSPNLKEKKPPADWFQSAVCGHPHRQQCACLIYLQKMGEERETHSLFPFQDFYESKEQQMRSPTICDVRCMLSFRHNMDARAGLLDYNWRWFRGSQFETHSGARALPRDGLAAARWFFILHASLNQDDCGGGAIKGLRNESHAVWMFHLPQPITVELTSLSSSLTWLWSS